QRRARQAPKWRAPVPVICVGNAVIGGAGKTQLCIDLAKRLVGRNPHILSRGYRGSLKGPVRVDAKQHTVDAVGDEPLILSRHAPTWVGSDRTATAQAACAAGAGILIMDDGFQNPALAKTINLLVIDGGYGFGNGRVFPAGPLRETASSAFARTDAVCVIGEVGAGFPVIPASLPRLDAAIKPTPDAMSVDGKKLIAFAGIGRPEKFFQTLTAAGADIIKAEPYPDHHPYQAGEIEALLRAAADNDCTLVTTEKDHVRLPATLQNRVIPFPVTLVWKDDAALQGFLVEHGGLS
ncbi:MAG: tetraacyldisaccharide 4'-kinase, partial [Rhodospirillales bacterium]